MSDSQARRLLDRAAAEPGRLRRHLLVAAALREALDEEPVVVGGTAQSLYTNDTYAETDLDVCVATPERTLRARLRALGFERDGRHWWHEHARVAVEFPPPPLDGSEALVGREEVDGGVALVIGPEDLYLDRVRQATAEPEHGGIAFHGALAIATASFAIINWKYVQQRLAEIGAKEPKTGVHMRRIHRSVRRRALRALS